MTTAARAPTHPPRPTARPLAATPGQVRAGARSGATLISDEISPRQLALLIVEGSLVGCAVLAVLLVCWYFLGDRLRAQFATTVSVPGVAAPGTAPTTYYRDRGDGTVMVLEIDGKGTRIKGTVDRNDVPLLKEDNVPARPWGEGQISSQSRINALGSSFR